MVNMVDVVLGCLCCIDHFAARDRNYPLRRSMVDHDHEGIKAVAFGEVSDEVTSDL